MSHLVPGIDRSHIKAAGVVALLALPMLVFVVLLTTVDPRWMNVTGHFYIVSTTTFIAAAMAAGLMLSIGSVRDSRTVYLALGFLAVAMIFMVHGLSTPGFLHDKHGLVNVRVAAGLCEVVGAFFIALSAVPRRWLPSRFDAWTPGIVAASLLALVAFVAVSLYEPGAWSFIPSTRPWDLLLAGLTLTLLAFAAWRYWGAWRLTHLPTQFAMVAALVFLAESQVSMVYGEFWRASWWLYHALLLVAYLTLVGGWAFEALRARSLILFARALTLHDELETVHAATPAALESLEAAMASRDEYTRQHMGRVAVYAVAIARELRCDPLTVELVEAAGRIHDIGKITVPEAVLCKPGQLTPGEFAQIKHHADRGDRIARTNHALAPVAPIIRAHHERFRGGGYPDGLAGDRIPFAARVVAVADTFDALTSSRVYRAARPIEEALAELRRVAGTQLDPDCVAAFLAWWEREGQHGRHLVQQPVPPRLLRAA